MDTGVMDDLTKNVVSIHCGPTINGYSSTSESGASARLDVQALPGVAIQAALLFN